MKKAPPLILVRPKWPPKQWWLYSEWRREYIAAQVLTWWLNQPEQLNRVFKDVAAKMVLELTQ